MAEVVLEHVSKRFPGGVDAVRDLSLSIGDGELVVLVGPSGCGKSTTLRMIAGLEEPTEGTIRIGGTSVDGQPPGKRDIGMVFQSAATLPHLSVADNIGFGLRVRGVGRAETRRRVEEVAAAIGLDGLLDRRPSQLSGGQRQRVAIARAMLRDPKAFLMDEPLSSLDARLRVQMRAELGRLQRRLGTTTIYVTHDQSEAMSLGDRVAVLCDGRLEQVASPLELYRAPATAFVAGFFGDPPMNLFPGTTTPDGVIVAGHRLTVHGGGGTGREGRAVLVGIRPTELLPSGSPPGAGGSLMADVATVEHRGSEVVAYVTLAGVSAAARDAGMELAAVILPSSASVDEGQTLALAVAPSAVHLFDAETGRRI